MNWVDGKMTIPPNPNPSGLLRSLSPELNSILDEYEHLKTNPKQSGTEYLEPIFRISSKPKSNG